MVATDDDADIELYQAILLRMAAQADPNGVVDRPAPWNKLVDQLQRVQLKIRESERGRAAISGLLDHESPTVRCWAAGHAVFWDEAQARAVLAALSANPDVGLTAVSAKYTLREFDAGRLDPQWRPR
jgi:hypothetical protein